MSTTSSADVRERIARAIEIRDWAVVGASDDPRKFGGRIYRNLKAAGYRVYAVNPTAETVDGDPVYASVKDLPPAVQVVDVVVPHWIGTRVARETAEAGIKLFWLQPGAESDDLIAEAEALGLEVIHDACAMVEKRVWDDGADEGHD